MTLTAAIKGFQENRGLPVTGELDQRTVAALQPYADAGLIHLDAGAVQLQPAGWPYARLIAAAFDKHFKGARHSAAV